MEADEKICPRCAETVKAAALVCKHCGHEFASAQQNIVPPPPAAPMMPPSPSIAPSPTPSPTPSPMPRSMAPPPAAAPAPRGRTFLVVAGIIVGVIVLLVILGALVGPGDTTQSAGNQPGAATSGDGGTADGSAPAQDSAGSSGGEAQASDSTAVTSVDLAKAYNANEVAAQKTYGDRTLDVSGTITGVTLDIFNNPVVQMEGVNEFLPVQATFDKTYGDKISALNKGDQITVRCTSITEVISAPQLSDCVLPE